MVFGKIKAFLSKDIISSSEVTEEEFYERIEDLIHTRGVTFMQACYVEDCKIYVVQLNRALDNKSISGEYYLVFRGMEVYAVRLKYIKGEPVLPVPPSFELQTKVLRIYDFFKYSMTVSSFIEYKGIYEGDIQ